MLGHFQMGLGKTLSIVSLIASTLPSARKFAQGSTKDEPSDSGSDGSDSDDKEDNVDISSFSRYIPDMPVGDASSKKRKRETGFKFTAQKIAKLERKGRLDRLLLLSSTSTDHHIESISFDRSETLGRRVMGVVVDGCIKVVLRDVVRERVIQELAHLSQIASDI